MRFFNVHKFAGFTLSETSVVLLLVGTLATIGTPSLLTWKERQTLTNSLTALQGKIETTRAQAIRLSQTCTINFPNSSNPIVTATPGGCLLNSNVNAFDRVSLKTSFSSPSSISFDFQGRPSSTVTSEEVIILFSSNGVIDLVKCLVIAPQSGLLRSGTYQASIAGRLRANQCVTS